MITADKKNGYEYLKQMVNHHISGQMKELKHFTTNELKINPEQAQIFTPTPSIYS